MVMGARCVWLVFFSIRDPTSLEAAGVRSDIGAAKFYIQDIAQQFQANTTTTAYNTTTTAL
jgi:hypothetical protein